MGPLGGGKAVGGHNLSGLGGTVYMCVFAIMVCNDSCQPYHITLEGFFGTRVMANRFVCHFVIYREKQCLFLCII